HILHRKYTIWVINPHCNASIILIAICWHQSALQLTAHALQRCRGQYALGRSTRADVQVNASLGEGWCHRACYITVREELNPNANLAQNLDLCLMTWTVQNHHR